MRFIEIENAKLKQAIKDKSELIEKGRLISKEIEALETERNKLGLEIQSIKDDIIIPAAKQYKKELLDKYEDFSTFNLVDDKIQGEVFNHIEEYTKQLDEELAKQDAI
jgi:hypothetical protein